MTFQPGKSWLQQGAGKSLIFFWAGKSLILGVKIRGKSEIFRLAIRDFFGKIVKNS